MTSELLNELDNTISIEKDRKWINEWIKLKLNNAIWAIAWPECE